MRGCCFRANISEGAAWWEGACALQRCFYDIGFYEQVIEADVCLEKTCGVPINEQCVRKMHDLAYECLLNQCHSRADYEICQSFRQSAKRCG